MAPPPDRLSKPRDPEDDARARSWAAKIRREAEDGDLGEEGDYLTEKLAEERRRLNAS